MQACKATARSHLAEVWDIDDIPNYDRLGMTVEVQQWMGLRKKEQKQLAHTEWNSSNVWDTHVAK